MLRVRMKGGGIVRWPGVGSGKVSSWCPTQALHWISDMGLTLHSLCLASGHYVAFRSING